MSELYKMDQETRDKVLHKMTTERDLRNQMAYARQEAIEEGREEGLELGREEGREEGREQGRKLGRELGRQEAFAETARKMLAMMIDIETISKVTGLSVEEIEKLR